MESDAAGTRRHWWLVFAATGMSTWVTTATFSTINVGLSDIGRSFPSYSLTTIGWVITAFSVVYAALLLPGGRIADRYGRRRVYTFGLALFGLSGVASAVAPGFALLLVARVCQAIGGAIVGPASLGLLLEVTDPRDRVRAITLWSACTTIGGTSGPTLGALLIDAASWRWALFVPSAMSILTWLIGRNHLPRSSGNRADNRLDGFGIAITAAGLALLVLAITEGNRWGWTGVRIVGCLAGAAACAATYVLRTLRHPEPVIPKALFRSRSFSVGMVASIVLGVSGGSIQLVNVLFLRNVWHYSPLRSGFAITPAPLFASLASPVAARVGKRLGERAVAIPGVLAFAASMVWYLVAIDDTPNYWREFFPAATLNGLAVPFTFAMTASITVRDIGPAHLSVANGASRAASQVGQSIGVAGALALIGAATGALGSYQDSWRLLVAGALSAIVCIAAVGRPREPVVHTVAATTLGSAR